MRRLDDAVLLVQTDGRDVYFIRGQLDGVLEIWRIALSLQLRVGHDSNRSVRSGAVDANDLALAVIYPDEAELRIGRLERHLGSQSGREPLAPGLSGGLIDRIDAAIETCAHHVRRPPPGLERSQCRRARCERGIPVRRRPAANASRCDRGRAAAAPVPGCDSSAIRPRMTAIVTSRIIAMASLVASVIFVFAPFPYRRGTQLGQNGRRLGIMGRKQYHRPVADDDDGRFAASRQPATAASSAAGLKGFCRLQTAPSLVAMVRKSGP